MRLLRETGEEDGLLGQGILKMYIDMADAGLDLYLPFSIPAYQTFDDLYNMWLKYFWKRTGKADRIRPWQC